MKEFINLFKKVEGLKIIKQYLKNNILHIIFLEVIILGISKKSLELVRLVSENKIINKLRKKYNKYIVEYKTNYIEQEHSNSNKIWICWLQGINNAPYVVKKCYNSICENLSDREIILITEDNYKEYVQFPDYIQDKIDKNIITKTHMSDLLRLELLVRYGGTWMDATVFCSGNNIPDYMLDSELFLFQNLKPGLDGQATRISSWFVTAHSNHPILILTQNLLYKYWQTNDSMVDYFLLHYFFELSIESYPNEWRKVVPFNNATPHILLLRLFEKYDENVWNGLIKQTPFHKLTYKYNKNDESLSDTYFSKIIGLY